MKWQDVGDQPCSVARTLSVIGDRWTMLILRNAFLGIRRFDDFQTNLGVTRHVLSERLKRLVEHEILKKVPYHDRQERMEYRLTEKGRDLYPVLLSIVKWGDQWMDEGLGAPLEYVHQTCGHKFTPVLVCSECGEPIDARHVTPRIGAGMIAFQAKKSAQG
ncbi:MAG: helix-turn-helix domain-containing protein [Pseudomonadota bacterium]|nr:helix-turn-helix domain-containing protein [Pseudomonadota bacterium]